MFHRVGPRPEPYGTPHVMLLSVKIPSDEIITNLSERYDMSKRLMYRYSKHHSCCINMALISQSRIKRVFYVEDNQDKLVPVPGHPFVTYAQHYLNCFVSLSLFFLNW